MTARNVNALCVYALYDNALYCACAQPHSNINALNANVKPSEDAHHQHAQHPGPYLWPLLATLLVSNGKTNTMLEAAARDLSCYHDRG